MGDNLPTRTIDVSGHIALRGGERVEFRLACTYTM